MKKEYSNGEVTIIWQPEKRIHSGSCARGIPAVFKLREKPSIEIEAENTDAIIEQVRKCHSAALSFRMNNTNYNHKLV